ncbi:MAG TPA: ABC transporter substrate-binding protein [Stellaceae bacterium]|jgi:ABC-type nitrate/sulfonate/bicarbonate transport system substrate-binding protein
MTGATRGVACWAAAALLAMAGTGHAADQLRVAKGASRAYSFMLLDVGLAANIFQKHGLDIQESSIDGAARLHQAMVANSIDIALGAGTDIAFIAKGSPEKGVGVMATEPLNMALVVGAKSPIHDMAGLKAKKIGVTSAGSLTDWFARQINFREGWKGSDASNIVALGSADGTASALIAGNIDALVGSVEGGYAMEQQGRAKVLFAFGDFVKPFITHAIYATNILQAQHPDALRRFLAAWYESIAYSDNHKTATVNTVQPILNMPADWVAKVYDVEKPMFPTDGHYDPAALKVVAKSLIDTGQMPADTDVSRLITEQYLP